MPYFTKRRKFVRALRKYLPYFVVGSPIHAKKVPSKTKKKNKICEYCAHKSFIEKLGVLGKYFADFLSYFLLIWHKFSMTNNNRITLYFRRIDKYLAMAQTNLAKDEFA